MRVRDKVQEMVQFLKGDIWRIRSHTLPPRKFFLVRLARITLLALRGFHGDKCALRASALTFFTVLSIVPAFAMAFGIAKGFGLDKLLEERIRGALAGQEEVAARIVEFSRALLENTRGGVMAGVGVVILLWTVVKVLGHVERSFNEIWGVQEHRTLARRFTDYLALVILCPIFFILSGAATVLVTAQVQAFLNAVSFLGFLSIALLPLLRLLPYCLGWALFAFVYIYMPNTKVNLKSGLVAGIVAGTLYQIVQWLYISFQIGVTRYSAIYGSFAVLPLFLLWLQVTWLVVLFGAELSFAHQNVETYEFEPDCLSASRAFKRLVALRITQLLVGNFAEGRPALTARQIARQIGAPIRLVNEALFDLVKANILSETSLHAENDIGYQPARSICELTLADVAEALDACGTDSIPLIECEELNKIAESLAEFRNAVRRSPANLLIKDI